MVSTPSRLFVPWAFAAALGACAAPSIDRCPPGTREVGGQCRVGCTSDLDCLVTERCDLPTEVCVPLAPGEDAAVRDAAPDARTDAAAPDAAADAGPLPDAEALDTGPSDGGRPDASPDAGPHRPTGSRVSIVGGGNVQSTGRYRLRLSISAPQPAGAAQTDQHRALLGPGGNR